MDVFADGSVRLADHPDPSLELNPYRTGTWAKFPDFKASTGRSLIKSPSKLGEKTKRVAGRAESTCFPARVSVSVEAERRHWSVFAPRLAHPLSFQSKEVRSLKSVKNDVRKACKLLINTSCIRSVRGREKI